MKECWVFRCSRLISFNHTSHLKINNPHIQQYSQKIVILTSSDSDVVFIQQNYSGPPVKLLEKYMKRSGTFSKVACYRLITLLKMNAFMRYFSKILTTSVEQLYHITAFCRTWLLWSTSQKVLLCSENPRKFSLKHPE